MSTISVVVPTIPGREQVLARALSSIIGQTRRVDEVIVETDVERAGAAATRNRALDKVTGEWIAFLDDDDTFYPRHLELLDRAAQDTGADLVYPWYDGINEHVLTVPVDGVPTSPLGVPFGDEQRQHLLTTANFIPITVLVRTQLLREVGGFSPPPWASPDNPCEDWGCWLKLLDAGATFTHVPEVTWTWREDVTHTSGRGLTTV